MQNVLPVKNVKIIDLDRMPDDPGRRADVDHAIRILESNSMLVQEDENDKGSQGFISCIAMTEGRKWLKIEK